MFTNRGIWFNIAANHRFDRTDITIRQQGLTSKGGVTICDDVWIGAHSVILDGVTIGQGSVIAAAPVITKDFMPYSMDGRCAWALYW